MTLDHVLGNEVLLSVSSSFQYFPRVLAELSELQEFYDPDAVELMNWIK